MNAAERYASLEAWRLARRAVGALPEGEEDRTLELLDDLWWQMTEEERTDADRRARLRAEAGLVEVGRRLAVGLQPGFGGATSVGVPLQEQRAGVPSTRMEAGAATVVLTSAALLARPTIRGTPRTGSGAMTETWNVRSAA